MLSFKSTLVFFLTLHFTYSEPAKIDRPVHEVINEQARIDEDLRPPTFYVNPLAGNQNVRLHTQNQQAMFNAERVRQHRAQIQRWTKAPQQTDSYMKAFQESQENHQLALEQLQLRDEPMRLQPKMKKPNRQRIELVENIKDGRPPERPQNVRERQRTENEENVREDRRSENGRQRSRQTQVTQEQEQKRQIISGQTRQRSESGQARPKQEQMKQGPGQIRQEQEQMRQTTGQIRQEKVQPIQSKRQRQRQEQEQSQTTRQELKRTTKLPSVVPTKITREDAIKPDRNRRHRSHGSVDYQLLQPRKYQAVYVSAGPTYDQGVTIKPNGNIGLTHLKPVPEETKLYTSAIPSKTQHVLPKQHYQMQNYQSAQDIDTLSSLLKKNPTEQLSELSALINSGKTDIKHPLDAPVDLLFYLKDNSAISLPQTYNPALYTHVSQYASTFMPEIRDHTPIIEELDDIEDPNRHTRLKTYGIKSVLATPSKEESAETTTTKNNNYYKIEVASQTISSPMTPLKFYPSVAEHEEVNPTYQTFHYTEPVGYDPTDEDLSEKYLHHNAQVGLHHLTGDGGISAYGSDDLQYAANYEFGYHVKDLHSGNDFGHAEAKQGGSTNGQYHVVLPDGRRQRVLYSAGPSGFHADVSYEHLI